MQCEDPMIWWWSGAFGDLRPRASLYPLLHGLCDRRSSKLLVGRKERKKKERVESPQSVATAFTRKVVNSPSNWRRINQASWITSPATLFGASMRAIPHGHRLFVTTRRCARSWKEWAWNELESRGLQRLEELRVHIYAVCNAKMKVMSPAQKLS